MPAKAASSFVCELFAMQDCVKSEPAKPASPAKDAKPGAPEKLSRLQEKLPTLTDAKEIESARKDIAKLEKDIKKAQDDLKKVEGQTASMMGLEKPYLPAQEPGADIHPSRFPGCGPGFAAVPRQACRGHVG